MITTSTGEWRTAPLVALDLEGSGAQDGDNEAILEIAVVPITAGHPDTASAYTTLINPGRAIPRKPWISPGLTTAVLATAPTPAEVEPELARRINEHIIVGHNVGVDWRLLHRRHPAITPTALIDTLRLARHLKLGTKNSLGALTDQLGLTPQIERLAPGSQPHRALLTPSPRPSCCPPSSPGHGPPARRLPTCSASRPSTKLPPARPDHANQPRKKASSTPLPGLRHPAPPTQATRRKGRK